MSSRDADQGKLHAGDRIVDLTLLARAVGSDGVAETMVRGHGVRR